ncbi:DUF4773 domain-containing protein [Trichonephila inaurata madagascariensis]|uniref:DUF4773 domain-containing protein n=1 Tax=Trichonephila inaurata madagascariensis TaxID=2747483 RepID=A0A8X6Y1H5_9ARAC|nr:DUF4773 domain-containing protein [Trichonephila inaurata madagascariensis]
MPVCVLLIFVLVNFASSYVTDNSTIVYMEEGSHSGCQCVKFECECCLVLDVPEIKLDNTICLHAAYLPKEYGISIALTFDDKILIEKSMSVRNPPSICLPIPFLKKYVHLCLTVYNLSISSSNLGACAKLDLLIWHLCKLGNVQIGCFDTRTHSVANSTPARIVVRRKREALTDIRKQKMNFAFPFNICSSSSRSMPNYYQVGLMLCVFFFVFKEFQKTHQTPLLYKCSFK